MLMRRLDHSMIFLLIAGTVTPFALLTMSGTWSTAILIAVWAGAAIGIAVELAWTSSPKWVSALVYVSVGWIGAVAFPQIVGYANVAYAFSQEVLWRGLICISVVRNCGLCGFVTHFKDLLRFGRQCIQFTSASRTKPAAS